jgi:hypothetical protein
MQIRLERSGGITGIPVTVTVDTSVLSPEAIAYLHRLIEAAHFFDLPATLPAAPQPDRFQYKVTVQEGDRSHTITVAETVIPDGLRPLLTWLIDMRQQG